jgi:serine/threonine protein kinase/TolB-like protein
MNVMLKSGEKIGKYRIDRLLGQGGMGEVYVAWDDDLRRKVALKLMKLKAQGAENALKRFRGEAQAIARLSSPHVVQVYEFISDATAPCIVMEYVDGKSLAEVIVENAPLPVALVLNYACQSLQGLASAHRSGVIHRDIKPVNILLSNEGVIKITDFGLARSLDVESGLTAEGVVVGTIHYLSPEVARGETATAQSDLYSLGITFYEMLRGQVPFDDESPLRLIGMIARETPPAIASFRSDISPAVSAWLHTLIADNPTRRYLTAEDALRDLEKIGHERGSYHSEVMSTAEIRLGEANAAPESSADAESSPPEPASASGVDASEIEAVMAEALRIEKQGRNRLNEESILDIAAELGVSEQAAREALNTYRVAREQRVRKRRLVEIAAVVAGGLMLIAVALHFTLRDTPKEMRSHQATGGRSGNSDLLKSVRNQAKTISVGAEWTESKLNSVETKTVLLVRFSGASGLECRVGDNSGIMIRGDYYGAPPVGTGEIFFRFQTGEGKVAAALAAPLRLAVLPFAASKESAETENLAGGTSDAVGARLAQQSGFILIERGQIDKVIANVKLEQTAFFQPETASRMGHLLGADYLMSGSVQKANGHYRFSGKCLQAETGEALQAVVLDGNDPFSLQDRLAAELYEKIKQAELDRYLGNKQPSD